MSGWLAIAGLGPGAAELVTPEVTATLAQATDLIGYAPYVARVPERAGLIRHGSDNREELDRAGLALRLAAEGKRVVGGFLAAIPACSRWRRPCSRRSMPAIPPGAISTSGCCPASARCSPPPLGSARRSAMISAPSILSDNLKPWELVERRLRLAAQADFVIALYNPLSKARPWQLGRAFELLREELPGTVPVVFASAISDAKEAIDTTTLREALAARADMRTLVLIGSSRTKLIERGSGRPFVYTPRSAGAVVVTEPAQHLGDAFRPFPARESTAAHHDHRQAELARGVDLGRRGVAAGVAGHHDVDAVFGQHSAVSGEVVRSARDDHFRLRDGSGARGGSTRRTR